MGTELNAAILNGDLGVGQAEELVTIDGYGPDGFQRQENSQLFDLHV